MSVFSRDRPGDWPASLDSVLIERLPVAVSRTFGRSFLAEMDALPEIRDRVFEDAFGDMVFELRAYIMAEKLADDEFTVHYDDRAVFRFPSSPWQHFKERYAPAWFLRRWPVDLHPHVEYIHGTKTVSVQQFALFPFSPLRVPEKFRGSAVVRYERAVDF